jgi:hypothetical protein
MSDGRTSYIRELGPPALELPHDLEIASVAAWCRGAYLTFLERALDGLSKRALAEWLWGPYRALVALGPAVYCASEDAPRSWPYRAPVRADEIATLGHESRRSLLGVLRGMTALDADISFTFAAIHKGWVARSRDVAGRVGWVPVDRPKMRLTERLISLVAVDYLVRPAEMQGTLTVCDQCDGVQFDAVGRVRGACRAHRASMARVAVPR